MAEILKYRENAQSPWQDIVALVGPQGEPGEQGAPFTYDMFTEEQLNALKGPQGEPGKDGENYILTDIDKQDIANLVLSNFPVAEEVSF